MKFSLEFNTENAVFDDEMEGQVEIILGNIIYHVWNGLTSHDILDINGNVIGRWEITE